MNRIVIVGDGYHAGKAVRTAGRIHPKADLLWISGFDDQKYSLSMLSLLLKSGIPISEWSKTRARIKVAFERYQQNIRLFPLKVKKIHISSRDSEVSFLSGMGSMSYTFDKVLVFPAQVVEHKGRVLDSRYLWPGDSCVKYLAAEWNSIENPVVVGSDMSLVQAMVVGGRVFTWVRTENIFTSQVQYFLDQELTRLGVKVITIDQAGLDQVIEDEMGSGPGSRPVFYCGQCRTDSSLLENYGLTGQDIYGIGSTGQYDGNVAVIDFAGPEGGCWGFCPETQLVRSEHMIRAALSGGECKPSSLDMMFWNLGLLSAARTGLNLKEADEAGYTPDFALVRGTYGISGDKPYVLSMVMDKPTKAILGIEAIGEKAHEWANLAAIFARNNSTVMDISNQVMIWPDPVINPFARCARMLENKTRPGILGITPDELQQSADEGAVFFLLDVRTKEEFALGRIPGAENIPLNQLDKRIMDIPRFTPIVIYSECSGRAYEAARLLKNKGAKQLYVLDGGYGLYTLDRDLSPLSGERPIIGCSCPAC